MPPYRRSSADSLLVVSARNSPSSRRIVSMLTSFFKLTLKLCLGPCPFLERLPILAHHDQRPLQGYQDSQ